MPGQMIDFELLESGGYPLIHLGTDQKVFSAGEPGDCLYVVKTGRINIVTYGTILESIQPHGVFGEMSLIDGAPRSATAIAVEPSVLAKVDVEAFRFLVQKTPDFALKLMQLMAQRLRQMNEGV